MVGCAAYRCKSSGYRKEPGVTFHRFPKDSEKRDAWTNNMKIANWEPSNNDRICSKHFEERFFYETNGRVLLLHGAIPTIFPELPKYLQPKTNTMPGQICAVASCKSNRETMKKKGTQISFHTFTNRKDLISSRLRNEWIRRCGRRDNFNPRTAAICSLHFTEDDFERDLQNELLGLPLRRILKKSAIPTLNLSGTGEECLEESPKETPHAKRSKKRQEIHRKNDTLEGFSESESLNILSKSADVSSSSDMPFVTTSISGNNNPKSLYRRAPDYKKKYENLMLKFNRCKSESRLKIKRLKRMLKCYETKFQLLSIHRNSKSLMAEHFLEEC